MTVYIFCVAERTANPQAKQLETWLRTTFENKACYSLVYRQTVLQMKDLTRINFSTSIDVLLSKNQALCEYCTHVNKLKHC